MITMDTVWTNRVDVRPTQKLTPDSTEKNRQGFHLAVPFHDRRDAQTIAHGCGTNSSVNCNLV